MSNLKKLLVMSLIAALVLLTACAPTAQTDGVITTTATTATTTGTVTTTTTTATTTGSAVTTTVSDGTTTAEAVTTTTTAAITTTTKVENGGETTTSTTTASTTAATTTTTTTTAATTVTTTRRTQRTQSNNEIAGNGSNDFRGKTVTIMSRDNFTGTSGIQQAYASGIQTWSTRYGSTVKFVTADYGYGDLQAAIAAGSAPDLFYQVERFPEVCAVGLVQPIDEYLPANQKVLDEKSIQYGSWRGHLWGMSIAGGGGRTYLKFDKELFAANPDIKSPRQLFEEGNWTWRTFRNTVKEMFKKTGYGVKFNQIATFGGHDIVTVAENGRVTSTLATDQYNIELLTMLYDMRNQDKVFDTEQFAMSVYQGGAEPKYGTNGETKVNSDNKYWEIVPFPQKDGTDEWVSHEQVFSFVVPVGAQNAAMSVDLALAILLPWKTEVDGYTYCDYEQKVRDTVKNATPILKYPDVLTYLPYNDRDATYGALYNTPTTTAINQLKDVHTADCVTYNSNYVE